MGNALPPSASFFFKRIFPLIFILFGAGTLCLTLNRIFIANDSVNWPTAQGTIVSSSVYSSKSSSGTTYTAKVSYTFEVEDKHFTGSRVGFVEYKTSSLSQPKKIVETYPVKKQVKVFYQPSDPTECVLEPGIKGNTHMMIAIAGSIILTVGIIISLVMPKFIGKFEQV